MIVDGSTHKRLRFDMARILVFVKRSSVIPFSFVVSSKGESFTIVVSMEPGHEFINFNLDKKCSA